MSTHTLIVTRDPIGDLEYSIECSGVDETCESWTACGCSPRDYELEALDADEYPEDYAEYVPCRKDGEEHRMFEFGLATRTGFCFVATHVYLFDAASDLGLPPGEYPVDFEAVDETGLTLHLLREQVPA